MVLLWKILIPIAATVTVEFEYGAKHTKEWSHDRMVKFENKVFGGYDKQKNGFVEGCGDKSDVNAKVTAVVQCDDGILVGIYMGGMMATMTRWRRGRRGIRRAS